MPNFFCSFNHKNYPSRTLINSLLWPILTSIPFNIRLTRFPPFSFTQVNNISSRVRHFPHILEQKSADVMLGVEGQEISVRFGQRLRLRFIVGTLKSDELRYVVEHFHQVDDDADGHEHDYDEISISDNGRQFTIDDDGVVILLIENLEERDLGTYECVLKNLTGDVIYEFGDITVFLDKQDEVLPDI